MSSIVKKGTLFVPKLKKNIRRRTVGKSEGPPTPSVTQESKPAESQKDNNKDLINEHELVPLTPEGTQVTFYSSKRSTQVEDSPEENIDPIDATKTLNDLAVHDQEEEEDDDSDDYGDNDIFKAPVEKPRRTSSVSHRRLSGIGIRKGSRSASISFTGTPRSSFSESEKPVLIQIPPSNKIKRRKSSSIRPNKRMSIASENSLFIGELHEPQIEEEEEDQDASVSSPTANVIEPSVADNDVDGNEEEMLSSKSNEVSRDELYRQEKYIIYALNKKGNKLQQYRTGDIPPHILEEHMEYLKKSGRSYVELPLAPEKVVMKVSKLTEIPRRIFQNESKFSQEIELDPESFTMKDLCNPELPIGSISSNFQLVKEAREREKKAKELRRVARKFAKASKMSYEKAYEIVERGGMDTHQTELIEKLKLDLAIGSRSHFGPNNEDDSSIDKDEEEEIIKKDEEDTSITEGEIVTKKEEDPLDTGSEYSNLKSANNHESIRLIQDAEGKIEINAESTQVTRGSNNGYERIREETNPFERPVISNTYSKRKHTDKWDKQEDMEFFSALSTWGTDFSMISSLFPHRSRKQIKSKFNLEEKKRPELVDLALRRKLPKILEKYEQEAGIKLSTKEEFERERDQLRAEHERQKKEILKGQERAKKEDDARNRDREIQRRSGQKPIERLTKKKQLRSNEEVVGTLERKR